MRKHKRKKKELNTRTKTLIFVTTLASVYTVVSIVYSFISLKYGIPSILSDTLTQEVFSLAKWVFSTSAAITVAKTVKGEDKKEPEDFDVPLHNRDEFNDRGYQEIDL